MSDEKENMTLQQLCVEKDMAIGHNLSVGGCMSVKGSARVGHDLTVDGWLEAPNLRTSNKGVFIEESELLAAYPSPKAGWYAGVVERTLAHSDLSNQTPTKYDTVIALYIVRNGQWERTDATLEMPLDIRAEIGDLSDLRAMVENHDGRIATLEEQITALMAGDAMFINGTKLFEGAEAVPVTLEEFYTAVDGLADKARYQVPGIVITLKTAEGWKTWQWVGENAADEWTDSTKWKVYGDGDYADIIDDIVDKLWPTEVSFTNNIGSVEYTGETRTVTLNWSVTKKEVGVVPSQVVIKARNEDGTVIIAAFVPSESSGSLQVNVDKGTSFSIEATVNGKVYKASTIVNMILPSWVTFDVAGHTAAEMVDPQGGKKPFVKKVVTNMGALSGTYTNNAAGQYLTIIVPSIYGITKVTSNGFDVPMQDAVLDNSIVIGGEVQSYKVYRNTAGVNAGAMTIVVS